MEMGYILPPPSTAAEQTKCQKIKIEVTDQQKHFEHGWRGSMDCDNLKATRRNTKQTA